MALGSSPESLGRRVRMIFLVCGIVSLLYYVFVLSPAPMYGICCPTVMARYSLFVLKVSLKPKQTNKQTLGDCWSQKGGPSPGLAPSFTV